MRTCHHPHPPKLLTLAQERFIYVARLLTDTWGTGEPPLFLGSSVVFAVRNAIKASRQDEGLSGWLPVQVPLTAENIRYLPVPLQRCCLSTLLSSSCSRSS